MGRKVLPSVRSRWPRAVIRATNRLSHNGQDGDRSRQELLFTEGPAYIEGEGFVIAMDLRGIACSTGAACSSGSLEPSHVLSAVGLTAEQARSSIRFSLSRFTTEDEIEHTLAVLPAVVEQLRSVSPHYKKPAMAAQG